MSKANENKRTAASFKYDLDLLRASKIKDNMERDHLINILTLTASENISCSQEIVDVIRNQMKVVSAQSKILIVALVFAIVSSVGIEYTKHFDKYIIEIFMAAFVYADPVGRMKLFEMRKKWDDYFSNEVLNELDCAAKKVDHSWPIIPAKLNNIAILADIRKLDEEKRILLAEIEKLEREAMEDSQKQMQKPKIIKQNPPKRRRLDQVCELESKWNGHQPSMPSDLKIDCAMDSEEDLKHNTCGIITPPPENDNAGKPTDDSNSFWTMTKSLAEKSPSLFSENNSEFVI